MIKIKRAIVSTNNEFSCLLCDDFLWPLHGNEGAPPQEPVTPPYADSSRHETCRMLAKERRGVQRSVLGEKAALLPVGQELVSHTAPRTVLRLALCYFSYG